MRKIIIGGAAVSLGLATALAGSTFAASGAGKPTTFAQTLCGSTMTDPGATATADGQSSEQRFGPVAFMGNELAANTTCDNSNSSGSDGTTWTIGHGNVDPNRERGTEHGQYKLASSSTPGGFNGHVTDWDFNGGDTCVDAQNRTVYYLSGTERDGNCLPDFGPVGNFNTHGGAATGDHSRGKYGTLIFQQNGNTPGGPCDVDSMNYCIQVDLAGQVN